MAKRNELEGQRFGRLVVLAYDGANLRGQALWRCRCDCGNEKTVPGRYLTTGSTKSCGCLPTHKKAGGQDAGVL